MEADVKAQLDEILSTLRQLLGQLGKPGPVSWPALLKPSEAAKRLGVPAKQLARLMRTGAVLSVPLGMRRAVPLVEVERIEREGLSTRRVPRPLAPVRSPREEAALARELTRTVGRRR